MRYFQSFSDKYLFAMQDNNTGTFYTNCPEEPSMWGRPRCTAEPAMWSIPRILEWHVIDKMGEDYFKEVSEEEATVWLLAWEGKDANH